MELVTSVKTLHNETSLFLAAKAYQMVSYHTSVKTLHNETSLFLAAKAYQMVSYHGQILTFLQQFVSDNFNTKLEEQHSTVIVFQFGANGLWCNSL